MGWVFLLKIFPVFHAQFFGFSTFPQAKLSGLLWIKADTAPGKEINSCAGFVQPSLLCFVEQVEFEFQSVTDFSTN